MSFHCSCVQFQKYFIQEVLMEKKRGSEHFFLNLCISDQLISILHVIIFRAQNIRGETNCSSPICFYLAKFIVFFLKKIKSILLKATNFRPEA